MIGAVKWTADDIPAQDGRTFVITGANSGIGLEAARALGAAGAHVVVACRDTSKGDHAVAELEGDFDVRRLDLADLSSVRAFAAELGRDVDVLIDNAGVMAVPRGQTADGFELQLGTNHLGHFALAGLLLPRIRDRVVTISSQAHRTGRINFGDLQSERHYQRWIAYGQSKLANLLFMMELARRLDAAGSALRSVAAHPGYSATNLQSHTQSIQDQLMGIANRLIAQSAAMGALPTLYAATADLPGAAYVGPDGLFEQRGHPKLVDMSGAAKNADAARRLWEISEELTGVRYDFGKSARSRNGARSSSV
jgi:NAD(P)-dependent dehydrogenase (short-subunit alcohol dehydrogenase family)